MGFAEAAPRMERAMEQLNRLTRSLRRARTVELPEGEAPGERALHFSEAGGRGMGGVGGRRGGAGGVGLPCGVRSERKCPRGPARTGKGCGGASHGRGLGTRWGCLSCRVR